MKCENCGSGDFNIYDSDIDLPGEWVDFFVTCNGCGIQFKVEATLKIERIDEI